MATAAVLAQYLRLAPYGENSHGIGPRRAMVFRPARRRPRHRAGGAAERHPAGPRRDGAASRPAARRGAGAARIGHDGTDAGGEREQALAELDRLAPVPAPRRPAFLQLALRLQHLAPPGGGVVRAAIDGATQRWLSRMAAAHLAAWRRSGAQQVAVMVVRRGTREVVAAIASAGYDSQPGGAIDYTTALRSPGSTLKPFLYALGLDRGVIAPQDVLADLPEGAAGISNADHDYLGPLLPRQALANSRNVPGHQPAAADRAGRGVRLPPRRSACTIWPGPRTATAWPWRSARCPARWTA